MSTKSWWEHLKSPFFWLKFWNFLKKGPDKPKPPPKKQNFNKRT